MTFEFGARAIVTEANWHIYAGERIGLIGYNGTGKSTLLKVLVGEYKPSGGEVVISKNTSIGYLHQDLFSFDTNDSILQVALGAFERVLELEKEIEALGIELEKNHEDEVLLHKYTDALHEMDTLGGYNIHHQTEEVLQGLGFLNADLQRPYKEFSGGWRMRVLLAKMILQQPDLLLLDEPTNHLDLPSIEWLEKYLLHYQGAVIIVSHDRLFLDRMVTKIVELFQAQRAGHGALGLDVGLHRQVVPALPRFGPDQNRFRKMHHTDIDVEVRRLYFLFEALALVLFEALQNNLHGPTFGIFS